MKQLSAAAAAAGVRQRRYIPPHTEREHSLTRPLSLSLSCRPEYTVTTIHITYCIYYTCCRVPSTISYNSTLFLKKKIELFPFCRHFVLIKNRLDITKSLKFFNFT
jgi:hypothetical protein